MSTGPKNASISGEGFRYYRWTPAEGGEPTDVLSVTSIRKLCGEPYTLVNWQIANVIDVAMSTVKRTVIGPRGGVKEIRVKDEFPGEFARRLAASDGEQAKLDDLRKWLREQADAPRNIAAIRGTIVHGCIETNVAWDRIERPYVESAFANLSSRDRSRVKDGVQDEDVLFVRNSTRQYWAMREQVPFIILAREPQVFNLAAGYAGSADALAWFLPEGVDSRDIPKVRDITLDDVKRIGGYLALLDWKTSKGVYCTDAETLTLTDDLRWVPAGSLRPGDGLWSFTAGRIDSGRGGRQWRRATVTANTIEKANTLRINLASGRSLIVTPDHPLLARRASGGRRATEGGTIWLRANLLRPGDMLPYYLTPWTEDESKEAGWFAGLLDGEGSLSGHRLSFAQKEGAVAERARLFMRNANISWHEDGRDVIQFSIRGDVRDIASLLGRIRPVRLLAKFQPQDLQASIDQRDAVVSVEGMGERTIASLTTTSGTYFSAGYGSHNTDHVVQAHAYMAAEFVGSDGIVDRRLTELLNATLVGGLVHIRPNTWGVHLFDFKPEVLRAFLGSCAFARFLASHPTPDTLFTKEFTGEASWKDDHD